jgi:hypothetical protein
MSHLLLAANVDNGDDEDDNAFFINADDIEVDIDHCEKTWTCLSKGVGIEMRRKLLPQQLRPHKFVKTPTREVGSIEDEDRLEPLGTDPESILPVPIVTLPPQALENVNDDDKYDDDPDSQAVKIENQLHLHSLGESKLTQYQRQYKLKTKKKREQEKSKPKIHAFNNLQYRTDDQVRTNPPGLTSSTLVSFPGKKRLCLFGGISESGTMNDTWIYELGLKEWHKIEFEAPVQQHNTSLSNLVVTSANRSINHDQNCFSPLSFNNYENHVKSVIPPKRCGHVAVSMTSNEMHIFGGQNVEKMVYYNDMWLFKNDPAPTW